MANQNIDNLRNVITDYPKLWEWEASFDKLPDEVKNIIGADALTILTENFELPGLTVGDATLNYKGAKAHYGTRMVLAGNIASVKFKEIKGATPEESWLVRKAMLKWLELVDNFFGETKLSIPQYKTSIKVNMQDETGASFYKVRYFGIRPLSVKPITLTYEAPTGEVIQQTFCDVSFQFDYWKDQYDQDFGAE